MTYRVQFTIPYYTLIPEDVVTNVWHFDWAGAGAPVLSDYNALRDIVASFYEDTFSNLGAASMAPWMRPAFSTIKIFDLTDPPPRVPVYTNTVPLTVQQGATGTIPTETAVVLSYHAQFTSGIANASRRGRIYVGGLGQTISTGDASNFPVPGATFRGTLATAAGNVLVNAPVVDWTWVVWSRTLNASAPVIGGWIDNAADTQRRRGQGASTRTLWP